MCGRFVLCSPVEIIAEEFHVNKAVLNIEPSYNIAPTQDIVIVKQDWARKIARCRWGFIPSWSKGHAIGNKMINARAETIAEKPAFRSAFKNQRCLIVADGFYEWKKEGKAKTPLYIMLSSRRPFGFSGLYNVWTSPNGEQICTCTIITTESNKLLSPIHDRMPVIMKKKDYDLWLDTSVTESRALIPLLKPYPSEEMEYIRVSSLVNSPRHNFPELIKPAEKRNAY